jgi:hypothetical protein
LLAFENPDVGTEVVDDLQDQKSGGSLDPLPKAKMKTPA